MLPRGKSSKKTPRSGTLYATEVFFSCQRHATFAQEIDTRFCYSCRNIYNFTTARVWGTTKQSEEINRRRFFISTILIRAEGVRRSLLRNKAATKHKGCLLSARLASRKRIGIHFSTSPLDTCDKFFSWPKIGFEFYFIQLLPTSEIGEKRIPQIYHFSSRQRKACEWKFVFALKLNLPDSFFSSVIQSIRKHVKFFFHT